MVKRYSLFTDKDIILFREGRHYHLYEKFGAHSIKKEKSVYFAVWVPHVKKVSLIGDFNHWNATGYELFPRKDASGIWEGMIDEIPWGTRYKYEIETYDGKILRKSDPFALSWEQNNIAASLLSTTWYEWSDKDWMNSRSSKNSLQAPISVYEVHIGSWMRNEKDAEKFLNYREIAKKLVPYVVEMGFTHVELMPIMEYPYDPSWGYQITGFYAATSRFGSPQDCMFLINEFHRNGIGVILDWVPSHFPGDENGLHFFNSEPLYEYADPQKGFHPEWKSYIFDYGKPEVKSFLISNAIFWLDRYHADGLRVDAVTSMLYLDYARGDGEWKPNILGGNENLEAKAFLRDFNTAVHRNYPDVLTIAEESSDYPLLTKPVAEGGIGFNMKWMMGWMHDSLKYFKEDFEHRKYAHHKLTFAIWYAFKEKYMMPLSHDEVVHGKSSLIYKMKGNEWQKFANLRLLLTMMYTYPGAKLLFMGNEFGQTSEWNFMKNLDWHLLQYPIHVGLQNWVKKLNFLYKNEPALYQNQFDNKGFEWLEADDDENSVYVYTRKGVEKDDVVLVVLNMQPNTIDYRIGLESGLFWSVIANSDDEIYGGSGVAAEVSGMDSIKWKSFKKSFVLKVPPLAAVILRQQKNKTKNLKTVQSANI